MTRHIRQNRISVECIRKKVPVAPTIMSKWYSPSLGSLVIPNQTIFEKHTT